MVIKRVYTLILAVCGRMVVARNCVDSADMVLEYMAAGAICSSCVSVVLKRLKIGVLVVGAMLSVDG